MPFVYKDVSELLSNGLQQLAVNTNITQMTPGSKTRFLLNTVFTEQADLYEALDTNLMQTFLRFTDDKYLDFFGDMMNRPRYQSTFAETVAVEQNYMFYVDSGNFGDINGGADFTIGASGFTTSTVPFEGDITTPGVTEQPVIEYRLTSDVTCPSDRSFVYAGIRAAVEGKESNLPANVLRRHNFTTYTQYSRGALKCTNRHAVSTGRNKETNDAYRYRLLNVFDAKDQAIRMAIRLAALSMPGVADIIEINSEQGPGSYSLYVQAVTPTVSDGLLNLVNDAVNAVSSYGVRPYVLAPQPLGLEFVIAPTWYPKTTSAQKASAYAAIREVLETTLSRMEIGEPVLVADLVRLVLSSSQYIIGMGLERSNNFERLYLTKSSPDANGVTRSLFMGDTIEPLYNERIILETSGRNRGVEFIT